MVEVAERDEVVQVQGALDVAPARDDVMHVHVVHLAAPRVLAAVLVEFEAGVSDLQPLAAGVEVGTQGPGAVGTKAGKFHG